MIGLFLQTVFDKTSIVTSTSDCVRVFERYARWSENFSRWVMSMRFWRRCRDQTHVFSSRRSENYSKQRNSPENCHSLGWDVFKANPEWQNFRIDEWIMATGDRHWKSDSTHRIESLIRNNKSGWWFDWENASWRMFMDGLRDQEQQPHATCDEWLNNGIHSEWRSCRVMAIKLYAPYRHTHNAPFAGQILISILSRLK